MTVHWLIVVRTKPNSQNRKKNTSCVHFSLSVSESTYRKRVSRGEKVHCASGTYTFTKNNPYSKQLCKSDNSSLSKFGCRGFHIQYSHSNFSSDNGDFGAWSRNISQHFRFISALYIIQVLGAQRAEHLRDTVQHCDKSASGMGAPSTRQYPRIEIRSYIRSPGEKI